MSKNYTLRDYQQTAVDLAVSWLKKNTKPALLELDTGAGKSIICAELAFIMKNLSGKKVLCLCPTAELVQQNAEKYALTGCDYSIYSASIGKSLQHDVIFATEGTFKKVAKEHGKDFSLVVLDESHKVTPTITKIIEDMREGNPYLRVIGMTATPYRLGEGYIYAYDENNQIMEQAQNPYFTKLLCKVRGDYLVERGYLTKPVVGKIGGHSYDTSKLKLNGTSFNQNDLDEAFCGADTKTSYIVADVINNANARQSTGVMFFAATVRHAHEVMASLPSYNSAIITGETPKAERKRIIEAYKAKEIKYLVNVAVLTTGFDAPHTDIVAILRATESASLLRQIIGRGLRLYEGKQDCLVLDYADNISRFFPDGNLFNPQIEAYSEKEAVKGEARCEECGNINTVSLRPNPDQNAIDEFGYFLDLAGERITMEDKPFPAHFSRRCSYVHQVGHNEFKRCGYYWSFKECQECAHKNDIAARFCESCKVQLIDPNDKLLVDFANFKNDLTRVQTDEILAFKKKKVKPNVLLVVFETPNRRVDVFFSSKVNAKFYNMVESRSFNPKTISYRKQQADSKYFILSDFNRPKDTPYANT